MYLNFNKIGIESRFHRIFSLQSMHFSPTYKKISGSFKIFLFLIPHAFFRFCQLWNDNTRKKPLLSLVYRSIIAIFCLVLAVNIFKISKFTSNTSSLSYREQLYALKVLFPPECKPPENIPYVQKEVYSNQTFFKKVFNQTLVVVKSHNRPDCLSRMLQSWFLNYPEIKVAIIDDSDDYSPNNWKPTTDWLNQFSNNFILLEPNKTDIYSSSEINISKARNILVSYASNNGYEFISMVDDDYVLEGPEYYETLFEILLEENADLVSCSRLDHENEMAKLLSRGMFLLNNGIFRVIPGITGKPASTTSALMKEYDCVESELFMQLFLARTEKIKNIPWDETLGMNEHYDWLLNVKSKKLKTLACNKIELEHISKSCTADDTVRP